METIFTRPNGRTRHTGWLIAGAAAVALSCTIFGPQPARAEPVQPPPVPTPLKVQAGNQAYLVGHATGTQGYFCVQSSTGFAWTFFGPQATLFRDNEKQIITHFLSHNPDENGALRATWQDSRDSSSVWGFAPASQMSSDPAFVAADAIPWLLLNVVGAEAGPTGHDGKLTKTTFIQRLNTSGGKAPADGCAASADIGKRALVPYTADYFFYRADPGPQD
jgi:uncharacterized protein DUF3455